MTIAPKTTSRMASVTGTLSSVAPPRLLPSHAWNCVSIDAGPTSSTRRPGWPACTRATTAWSAGTRASAVSGSPDIVARTRTADPSSEVIGPSTEDTSASAPRPAVRSAAAAAASVGSRAPDRAVSSAFSTSGSTCPASAAIRAATPDSPTPSSSELAACVGVSTLSAAVSTTTASQMPIAVHRWVALQVAILVKGPS